MPKSKSIPAPALRCRRKFLRFFPGGFRDPTYLDWERNYKAEAHARWMEFLAPARYRSLLRDEIAKTVGSEANIDEEIRYLCTILSAEPR